MENKGAEILKEYLRSPFVDYKKKWTSWRITSTVKPFVSACMFYNGTNISIKPSKDKIAFIVKIVQSENLYEFEVKWNTLLFWKIARALGITKYLEK